MKETCGRDLIGKLESAEDRRILWWSLVWMCKSVCLGGGGKAPGLS